MIEQFVAIVPAHDEAAEIEDCLVRLHAAADRARRTLAGLEVRIIAVADDCTDDTLEIIERFAAGHPSVIPLTVPFSNVGRARDAGARFALCASAGRGTDARARTWLAFTDADSRVPEHWVTAHLAHAEAGADCVVGTVEPRPETASEALIRAWRAAHRLDEGHAHVFGANLGVRGSVFDHIGGVPGRAVGEDLALVAAVEAAGGEVHRTDDCRVATSARLRGRCHGGFSTYLQGLV